MPIKPETQNFLNTVSVDPKKIPAGVFYLDSINGGTMGALNTQITQIMDQDHLTADKAFERALSLSADTDLLTRLKTGLHGTQYEAIVAERLGDINRQKNEARAAGPERREEQTPNSVISDEPRQEDLREHNRAVALTSHDHGHSLRGKQAVVSTAPHAQPTHYGHGQNEIVIEPDRKDGQRNGKFVVMSRTPDGNGWVAVPGVSAVELAQIRKMAQAPGAAAKGDIALIADAIRTTHLQGNDNVDALMEQLNGTPPELAITIAQLRADQAAGRQTIQGHEGSPDIVSENLPPLPAQDTRRAPSERVAHHVRQNGARVAIKQPHTKNVERHMVPLAPRPDLA